MMMTNFLIMKQQNMIFLKKALNKFLFVLVGKIKNILYLLDLSKNFNNINI